MRSKWVGVAVVAAVAVIFAFIGPKTGWFDQRPQYSAAPTCREILASPTLEDAFKVAFSGLAGERRETSMDLPNHPVCAFQAEHTQALASTPSTGMPFSRSLRMRLDAFPEEWTSSRSPSSYGAASARHAIGTEPTASARGHRANARTTSLGSVMKRCPAGSYRAIVVPDSRFGI